MLFNSYVFLFLFLPIVLGGFYLVTSVLPAASKLWLIGISFVFYGWWNPPFLLLFMASIGFNYLASLGLDRLASFPRRQTALLALVVTANVGLLVYFKYLETMLHFLTGCGVLHGTVPDIVLPLGISFFTFTQIGFLVDKKAGLITERGFVHYVLFVSFFPHLIAGPILHHREIMPQFAEPKTYRFSAENLSVGLAIFAFGLVKKTLFADTMIPSVRAGFGTAGSVPLDTAWLAVLSYALQIYFDFSGYTDMAIGVARMFNIRFPVNFNSPYKAASIIELWQRWHITLSRYLALYIYNPMALAITRRRAARNLAIGRAGHASPAGFATMVMFPTLFTMALAGMWHGAGLQYLAFGVIHGIYLSINHAFRIFRPHRVLTAAEGRVQHVLKVALTFLATLVALVFFRSHSLGAATDMLRGMIGLHGFGSIFVPSGVVTRLGAIGHALLAQGVLQPVRAVRFIDGMNTVLWVALLYVIVWFCPNTQQIMRGFEPVLGRIQPGPLPWVSWQPSVGWAATIGAVLTLGVLAVGGTSEFLYFQF